MRSLMMKSLLRNLKGMIRYLVSSTEWEWMGNS